MGELTSIYRSRGLLLAIALVGLVSSVHGHSFVRGHSSVHGHSSTHGQWKSAYDGKMMRSVTCKFNLPVYEKKETTFGDCIHVCMIDARCTHYFWNSIINILKWDKGTCHLMQTTDDKEVIPEIGRHLPFTLCGYRVQKQPTTTPTTVIDSSTEFSWKDEFDGRVKFSVGCEFESGLNFGTREGSKDDCGRFCLDDRRCTHYNWITYTCYLNTIVGDGISSVKETESNDQACGYIIHRVSQQETQSSLPSTKSPLELKEITQVPMSSLVTEKAKLSMKPTNEPKKQVMADNGRIWIEETNFKWSHQCEYTQVRPYDRVEMEEKEECASNCLKDDRCAYFYWMAETCYKIKDQKGKSIMTEVISGNRRGSTICGFIVEKLTPLLMSVTFKAIQMTTPAYTPTTPKKEELNSGIMTIKEVSWEDDEGSRIKWSSNCVFPEALHYTIEKEQHQQYTREECGRLCLREEKGCSHFQWFQGNCQLMLTKESTSVLKTDDQTICGYVEMKIPLTQQYQQQEQAYYTEFKETMEEDDIYKGKSENPTKYEMNVQKLPEISELGFWLSNLSKGKRNARNLGIEK